MPIVRGAWAELLAPGLNAVTFNKLRERPEEYRQFMSVRDSRKAYEDDFELSGFGPLAEKGELAPTILDEPIKLGGVRFIHKTYALGFAISKEMRDDDQYGIMNQLAAALGRSSRLTSELYGVDIFNNAFTTTKYVGRDGKALFATDHPIVGTGGTYANKPAVDVDLSQAALEAGITAFENFVDDRGIPTVASPAILLISPENWLLSTRLLQSAGYPGTNNNDINPIANLNIRVVVSHFLLDKDAWFLLAPPGEHDLRFYWREMPDTNTWDDDGADATFYKIRQRHSVGFGDPRNVYGSTGA